VDVVAIRPLVDVVAIRPLVVGVVVCSSGGLRVGPLYSYSSS
jgi:hypothetical protein